MGKKTRQSEPRGRRLSRRGLYSLVGGLTAVLIIASTFVIWQSATSGEPRRTAPQAGPVGFQTPAPEGYVALSPTADTSDAFDWWNVEEPAADVMFLASDEAHSGDYSMLITSGSDGSQSARLEQSTAGSAGSTYSISFWVKSDNAVESAVELSPGPGATPIPIPAGTYDWTQVTASYIIPAGQSAVSLRIIVRGPTAATWIDSLSVTVAGDAGQLMQNADFESHSAELTFTNPTLLLNEGDGHVVFSTRRSSSGWFSWAVKRDDGRPISTGESLITNHEGAVDVSDLGPGMYDLSLSARIGDKVIDRTVTFAIVTGLRSEADGDNSPFGVFLHYLGGESRLSNMVDSLAIAGIRHARVEMPWHEIEREPGVYAYPQHVDATLNKFAEVGIDPLMVPVYGNGHYDSGRTPSTDAGLEGYANFSGDIASHYATIGSDFEVYNEFDHIFNSGKCGTTPDCYMDMLSVTADAVRQANPDAVIAAPGNAGMGFKFDWLKRFISLGGLEYTDVVSAHPYVQPDAPEVLIGGLEQLRQLIKDGNNGQEKPIWLTEMGWASVPDWITQQQQADYLVRTMAVSLANGVERVYWFEAASLNLHEGDRESNFGLFAAPSSLLPNTNEPKPAAVAQAVMARQIAGRSFSSIDLTAPGVNSYVFAGPEGDTRIMWSTGEPKAVTVASEKAVTVTDFTGESVTVKPVEGFVTVELTGSPIYVSGAVTAVVQ